MSDMGIPHGAGAGALSGKGGLDSEEHEPSESERSAWEAGWNAHKKLTGSPESEEHEERLFGVTIERGHKLFAVAVIANRSDGDCVLHFDCQWDEPLNADEAEIMANALHAAVMLMRA